MEEMITIQLRRDDAQLVLSRVRQMALQSEASHLKYGDTFAFSRDCGRKAAQFGRVAAALDMKLEQPLIQPPHIVSAANKMCSPDCCECQMAASGDRTAHCPSWDCAVQIKEVCDSLV